MTDSEEEQTQGIDWQARLDRVHRENQELGLFVMDGKANGTISKEGSRAFFRASVNVMRRAGIIEPQFSGEGVGAPLLCTVGAQANHEARIALLAIHPELAEELNRRVPPAVGERSR